MTVEVSYGVMVPAVEVLRRQSEHCTAIEAYVRRECGIHDDTGLLLAMFAPPAFLVLEAAAQAIHLAGQVGTVTADQLQRAVETYVETDEAAHRTMNDLARRSGQTITKWEDPTAGIDPVGPAQGGAPSGYGSAGQWFGEDISSAVDTVQRSIDEITGLPDDVRAWGGSTGGVVEKTDPQSYLVTPDLGRNEVQELRWSAGVVLGGIDWLAEQLLSFSILEEVVFKPFGGDFQDIKKAAAGWSNTSAAFTAVSENYVGLLAPTAEGWRGEAAEAFRAAITAAAAAYVGFSQAASYIGGLTSNIALVSQLACIAIGKLLKSISQKLIRMAAEAAVPVVGWAVAAGEALIMVQDIISKVRTAYTLIEMIITAITGFIEGKAQLLQSVHLIEDIAEYAFRRATA